MRDHTLSANVEELLRHSQMELLWIQRQLAMIAARNIHHHQLHTKGKSRCDVSTQQATNHSTRFRLLEERNRALKLEVATLRQEKQQYRKLRAKLHAALQEKNRLNLELIKHHLKASKYEQVRSDYDQLRQNFAVVSQERDVAQQQRSQLQGKVENLEQVLKHMHEAVELKQQLQIEHEQALVALHTKQKEINQLQKAWVQADQEHEEAVHLLEVNICDLEQQCRSQSEHLHQLSKELLNFRSQSDTADILKINSTCISQILISPDGKLPQVIAGFEAQPETGESAAATRLSCVQIKIVLHILFLRSSIFVDVGDNKTISSVFILIILIHPEAELPLVAGKYLYVYGDMDDDGFYEGELLDGQRGLVPSNFVEFVQDKEKLAIQPGEGGDDLGPLDHTPLALMTVDGGTSQDGLLGSANALVPCSNGTGGPLDPEDLAEDVVPYPRKITLIKQLARSVIVAWEPPLVPLGWGNISGYNVLIDGELRASIQYGGRTKCLLEKLDLDGCVHRVSVQCVTDRGLSDELRCTLLVGANVVVAPCGLRVDDIQRDTAELLWLPSNSNYGHTVFLDGVEHAVVKPGRYRLRFLNLKPLTVYKVTVVAQPHQVPWQLPLEQRERKEAGVEFCTQAAGPPLPPQDVQVMCGQGPGVVQVCWKPPILSPTGTSNGANVIGYAVCTKGQRIAEVLYPMADYVTVDLTSIQCLEAREVIVRTLSVQGESQDSQVAAIPNNLLVPLPPLPLPPPMHPHAGPLPHPHVQPHLQSPHLPHPPVPIQGHTLEAPPLANPRSPSPQRILPQPRGTLIPDTVAKAIAREAAQRVAAESEQGHSFHQHHSDEEEEDEEGFACGRRRGPSVDEFLRGSELGRPPHYSHNEDYHSESSRGSDLSDIMEEDEEELYSEMQLEEGRRRNSHNTPKVQFFALILNPRVINIPNLFFFFFTCGLQVCRCVCDNSQTHSYFLCLCYFQTNTPAGGRHDREAGRRIHQGGPQPQRRPLMVPSIDGYRDRDRCSPTYYDESEPEESFRIFVALFDYDPLSMSPNPDAADEELPFKEGQIIRIYGDKDTDGFYRGEVRGRMGLIPCNMVSEIRAEDEETMEQLIKQGFLPLSTPVDRIEQNRRGLRRGQPSRRMVALYDYDPRESSPNVDVEAELTFCAGDIMAVFGDIDEDGFYYGEINGHRGLVPSNFLEEVPDDVEVYLTDTPSHYPQEEPANRPPTNSAAAVPESKRVHHHRRSQR
uniref:SH3 domain-containing protein n=1 Tax=Anabas testudineus TaxID=64144 RepID=A0A7N6F6E5_ANATE